MSSAGQNLYNLFKIVRFKILIAIFGFNCETWIEMITTNPSIGAVVFEVH